MQNYIALNSNSCMRYIRSIECVSISFYNKNRCYSILATCQCRLATCQYKLATCQCMQVDHMSAQAGHMSVQVDHMSAQVTTCHCRLATCYIVSVSPHNSPPTETTGASILNRDINSHIVIVALVPALGRLLCCDWLFFCSRDTVLISASGNDIYHYTF